MRLKWSLNVETVRRLLQKLYVAASQPSGVFQYTPTNLHPSPFNYTSWNICPLFPPERVPSNGRLHFVNVRFEQTNNLLFHSYTYYWYGTVLFMQYSGPDRPMGVSLALEGVGCLAVWLSRSGVTSSGFLPLWRGPIRALGNHLLADILSVILKYYR